MDTDAQAEKILDVRENMLSAIEKHGPIPDYYDEMSELDQWAHLCKRGATTIARLEAELERVRGERDGLREEIERRDMHRGVDGCSTGDCDHESVHQCCDSMAETVREQSAFLEHAEEIEIELKSELEIAREVIGRLPKTADGVPVAPGSVVYMDLRNNGRWSVFGIAAAQTVHWDTLSPQAEFRNTPEGNEPGQLESIFHDIEFTYSTREAALSARQPGEGVGDGK